jgi:hypothetical protein
MKILFAILLFAAAASANTVNLSSYATANDGLDDSAGFRAAIADLPEGGTIIIDGGTWNLNSPVSFVTYSGSNSYTLKGQKGAVLKPRLGPSQVLFVSGNQYQMSFEDLIVLSDQEGTDMNMFVYADYLSQLRIRGCQFLGLRVQTSLIYAGIADVVIKDSLFHGLSAGEAVIIAKDSRGLTVEDSEFFDYASFNGHYYSKTPFGVPAWIKITSTNKTVNALGQRGLMLSNVRFDEGSTYAVDATGILFLRATNVLVNVSGVDAGAGFNLNDVKYAEVKMSMFGYSGFPRPAIKAFNNTTVYVDGVALGAEVFYGVKDATSQAFFNLKACTRGCYFNTDYNAAATR